MISSSFVHSKSKFMENICLVSGAGFSKLVAKLPITNEMLNVFKKEIEKQDLLNHKNRVKWGKRLSNFIDKPENEFLKIPYAKAEESGDILNSNYLENFEGLCSFIDLHLAFEVQARCENKGIKAGLTGKPCLLITLLSNSVK
jgi:hypothetical protein